LEGVDLAMTECFGTSEAPVATNRFSGKRFGRDGARV
jgi:hypothetical protein